MKNQLGRIELLQWLNNFVEADYPKIEACADAVAYIQVVDALYPNSVQLTRVNFNCKNTEENIKNLKILDEMFTKLKIEKQIPIEKVSKGVFQENMNLLVWLFNYVAKVGPFANQSYQAYEKRKLAFQRQKQINKNVQMSTHLIPNNQFFKFDRDPLSIEQEIPDIQTGLNIQAIEEQIDELENELRQKMESNWKSMFDLEEVIMQRKRMSEILNDLLKRAQLYHDSVHSQQIINIITSVPDDFK